ncbi:MAG: transposase [Acidobacteria bacterium]|nr:transposase [Acidobacteriota bacterium]
METTTTNLRESRGLALANRRALKLKGNAWHVPSESGTTGYKVDLEMVTCNCADYMFRQVLCKHIYAAQFRAKELLSEVADVRVKPIPFPPKYRKSYGQNWTAYNQAQTSEKSEFQRLLAQLCSGVEEPAQTTGRPRLPLADMLFSCIFKSYSTFSGRRFNVDLQMAHTLGYLSRKPHYNSLFRYFEKPELTPILEWLVEESARPLSALETSFAMDATALGVTHGFSWKYAKYERPQMITKREWKKVHAIVGVKTNVICSAIVTAKTEHEMNYFAPLLEAASRNFDVTEVLADNGYLSKANLQTAVDNGVYPYIAWRSNNRAGAKSGNELWDKLFHLFALNRPEFLRKYSMRSNAETTFSMLKMKFGAVLRSKTPTAQTNEALARCVAHNLCCLIQSIFELGINPEFAPKVLNDAPKPD